MAKNIPKLLEFDFISDEKFRASLVSDYREMKACERAQSWKAVYVLAGSIVEALLIEYLVMSGVKPGGKDPLKIDLSSAIEACEAEGVLRKETSSLCGVVREYRNLIHPGRVIRLHHGVSAEGAVIAANLVSLIAKEVEERRKINYGPTGEQIVAKLKLDQHALALLPNLLSEAKTHEREKLITFLIPQAYSVESAFVPDEEILSRFRVGYRQALESLPPELQKNIAKKFATLVRSESTEKIQEYGDAFFLAKDISHLQPKDAAVVVKHLLTRLQDPSTSVSEEFIECLTGIGQFITKGGALEFADALIRLSLRHKNDRVKVSDLIFGEYLNVNDDKEREEMTLRIAVWLDFAKEKGYSEKNMERLKSISNSWLDFPF